MTKASKAAGAAKATKATKTGAKATKTGAKVGTGTGAKKVSKADIAPAVPTIDAARLSLLARPLPAPEVVAAITAAVQLVWPRPAQPEPADTGHDAWRFSGRWWAQPTPMRRARPWARR